MNITSLRKPATAVVDWLKKLPKAVSISLAFGIALLVFAVIAAIPHRDVTTSAASVIATPVVPRASAVAARQTVAPAAAAPAPTKAVAAVPLQAATETPAVAPAVPIAPPSGLVAGQVFETISNADQFGQYAAVSARAVGSVRTSWQSYVGPAYSPAWRETITGWFQLFAPATVATLRRGGGAAANQVSAEIDGASLGPALRGPASEVAALPLAAGWHSFAVVAENKSLGYQATTTPIELAVGNGADAPMPVEPWAVVSSQAASAALTAPSASTASIPKANTPAPPTTPASVAPPAKTPMGTSTAGAKK